MMCKPCNKEMDSKTNMNGPRVGFKPDAVLEWHCPDCNDGWSLYQNQAFFGARNRRRIMNGEGARNGR